MSRSHAPVAFGSTTKRERILSCRNRRVRCLRVL